VTPERLSQIEELYHAVRECEPGERTAFLAGACDGDEELRREVESLLAANQSGACFLDQPVMRQAAWIFASQPSQSEQRLAPGLELGHFSLLEIIGEGGMGRVYKARDKRLARLVAIKLLPESRQTDTGRCARFVQEAKAASALNHPNIVTIHEIGEQDGRTFIVMELVDGKPLNALIPRKGMRLTEGLRIATQVADALTAAHAAGIVHRDLKPANIMVDAHGRVKVLDFGLAKLTAPAAGAGATPHTLAMDQPVSEEGVIVGSVPYMSPEQAEGKPLDARSDIFSFGAVLYEMITGQRAFRGQSQIATLAAIVERDPPPVSKISSTSPPDLERLIARCLRKDVNRRSQNMADVRLALEELRDESESGNLARPAVAAEARARRWVWPAAAACVLIAAAAFTWIYPNLRGTQSRGPDLVRLSPEDGHSYRSPAISPDGEFVAYVSDRSGKDELWLQQVGGGDPIQLTHSSKRVAYPAFLPEGKRIVYASFLADETNSAIETISTLGGEPRVLVQDKSWGPAKPSPDGRQIAYFDTSQSVGHLMTIPSDGGRPRELPAWARMRAPSGFSAAWTSNSRYLLSPMLKPAEGINVEEADWFAFPVDGGNPVATGAGAALRRAGLALGIPTLMTGDRVLFYGGTTSRNNTWEMRLLPGSWRVEGRPHQLTFGTLNEWPVSISATGSVALDIGGLSTDFYLIPLSPATGQPIGAGRRLTQDGRRKRLFWELTGDPGSAYFGVFAGAAFSIYGVDLDSWKQALVMAGFPAGMRGDISPDGRQVAYSVAEGGSYSIRVGDAGATTAEARVLCKACGMAEGFSRDGRFLFHAPEVTDKYDYKTKLTVRILEVVSGKDRPWLEHPTDSVMVGRALGRDSRWLSLLLFPTGSPGPMRRYLVPWREEPVPQAEWTKIPLPDGPGGDPPWRVAPPGNFFYLFEGSKLMAVRFDAKTAAFGEHREVKFIPGSAVTLKPDDDWTVRAPGLVFSRDESSSSVWLMKLPH
jgi:tRNA A-37 threonylcarbamoyl transferase component Bud32